MNVDDDRLKRLTAVLANNEDEKMTLLPWRHGVTDSLRHTAQFINSQKDEFACITKIKDSEYVTVPCSLYLKLLHAHRITESLDKKED